MWIWIVAYKTGSDLLSRGRCPSIIGAWVFHFRVRDGNGCLRPAMAARKKARLETRESPVRPSGRPRDGNGNMVKPHGTLVPVG